MILKSKIAKFSAFIVLLLTVLWIATPKVYIHKLLNHHHEVVKSNGETTIQSESTTDCEFEKYNTPIYFTIFKFINNFIPLKPKQEAELIYNSKSFQSFIKDSDSSRAPPRA